jgi:outer membrane protein TolC
MALNRENARLLQQFVTIAKTKFGTGEAALQDVLKANVELAKLENQGTVLQQQDQSGKAMLMAILNRQPNDTLGVAALSENVVFRATLDTLQQLALQSRPMLLHDSLMVEESRAMLSLSKREYLPDIKLGVQYVTVPVGDFRGWSISAGITLPFAPWTLGKASSRVEEAAATISKSSAALNASRNMVMSNVKDLYFKAQSARRQYDSYRTVILHQAQQSLKASMTAYQNGRTDFLMLVDAYRTLVELSMESLMVRMQFEQAVSDLERQVGVPDSVSN